MTLAIRHLRCECNFFSLKRKLGNVFNVKNRTIFVCTYVLYVNCDLFKKILGDGPDFNKIEVNNVLINGY